MAPVRRRWRVITRLSVTIALVLLVAWTLWHVFVGEVPSVRAIKLFGPEHVVNIPFELSHWVDVIVGVLWVMVLGFFLSRKELKIVKLLVGIGFGGLAGLVLAYFYGFLPGMVMGLLLGLLGGWMHRAIVCMLMGIGGLMVLYLALPVVKVFQWYGRWVAAKDEAGNS